MSLKSEIYYKNGNLFWKKQNSRNNRKMSRPIGSRQNSGHINFNLNYIQYYVHRVVWEFHHGKIPNGKMIDHINGEPGDNRIENLRLANFVENSRNRKKTFKPKSSKYKGVSFKAADKRFQSSIFIDGKYRHIGSFKKESQAALAYNKMAAAAFGKYAVLNEVTDG